MRVVRKDDQSNCHRLEPGEGAAQSSDCYADSQMNASQLLLSKLVEGDDYAGAFQYRGHLVPSVFDLLDREIQTTEMTSEMCNSFR